MPCPALVLGKSLCCRVAGRLRRVCGGGGAVRNARFVRAGFAVFRFAEATPLGARLAPVARVFFAGFLARATAARVVGCSNCATDFVKRDFFLMEDIVKPHESAIKLIAMFRAKAVAALSFQTAAFPGGSTGTRTNEGDTQWHGKRYRSAVGSVDVVCEADLRRYPAWPE
jgi:hypothetical protein